MRTPQQIRAFQSDPAHVNPFGQMLKVDGVWGPQCQWAEDFLTLAIGRQAIIHRAWEHLGLVETGPNTDPGGVIAGWLQKAGAQPGDPYCASAASDWLGGYRSASAVALGQHYPAVPFESIMPADLLWFRTDTKGHGHVELVLGRDIAGRRVMTIGGNVANGVRLSLRPSEGVNFSRTVNDSRGVCPGILHSHSDVPMRVPSFAGTR